jgi:uncharacterized protein (TIGR04141 family)
LTPDFQLICVKPMTASKALSHLFAQGVVSAELLQWQPDFMKFLRHEFRKRWPGRGTPAAPKIVFLISTTKPGPLSEAIYGFSAINLAGQISRIQQLGFQVALCATKQLARKQPATHKAKRAA